MKSNKTFQLDKTDLVPMIIWMVITFITWTFMSGANQYLKLTPEALGKYYNFRWILIAHITAGGGTLIFGFIQFWRKLRIYSYRLHRIVGVLYVAAILVSSTCALVLSFTTAYKVNFPFAFALQIWAAIWISSTAIAYYHAIRKRFKLHEEWMIRSYIITLSFVIQGLLLKTAFVQRLGSFDEISPSFIWMGWTIPLYVYEIVRTSKFKYASVAANPSHE